MASLEAGTREQIADYDAWVKEVDPENRVGQRRAASGDRKGHHPRLGLALGDHASR